MSAPGSGPGPEPGQEDGQSAAVAPSRRVGRPWLAGLMAMLATAVLLGAMWAIMRTGV
jgi:cobalamin biosynthesis Mg chelatase CobN